MEDGVILERLRGIDAALQRIESERLRTMEEHAKVQDGRIGAVERWQSQADAMHDSLNERVGANCDEIEKLENRTLATLSAHQSYIDKQEGGMSARTKTFVDITMLVGMLVALLKLFIFHN